MRLMPTKLVRPNQGNDGFGWSLTNPGRNSVRAIPAGPDLGLVGPMRACPVLLFLRRRKKGQRTADGGSLARTKTIYG